MDLKGQQLYWIFRNRMYAQGYAQKYRGESDRNSQEVLAQPGERGNGEMDLKLGFLNDMPGFLF